MRYRLSPNHPTGKFRKTIRVTGRADRFVVFTIDQYHDLDAAEVEFLERFIVAELLLPEGKQPTPQPPKEPPRRDECENEPDPVDDRQPRGMLRRISRYLFSEP